MKVYHGSFEKIESPDILHSRTTVDFGPGFYVTSIKKQAETWAGRFEKRGKQAIVSEYEFDENAYNKVKSICFDSYSDEWLEFVVNCRNNRDTTDYEIVAGGIADDRVFNTIELYLDGLIERDETIRRLKYEKPNVQICLRSQRAINTYLRFERSYSL